MNILNGAITLRAIEMEDQELLLQLINDPEIENMLGGSSFPVSLHGQKNWFGNLKSSTNELRVIVEHKDLGAVGVLMLTGINWKDRNAEFHIKLLAQKLNGVKGVGTLALATLVDYAFNEMNLHVIYSNIIEYNKASIAIHKKCGFQKEGVLKSRVFKNGKYHNLEIWAVVND